MKIFLFTAIFLTFAAGTGSYLTWRVFYKTSVHKFWKLGCLLAIVALFLTTPVTILFRRAGIQNTGMDVFVWIGYLGLGFLSFLFTVVVIRDALLAMAGLARAFVSRSGALESKKGPTAGPENPSRRGFLVQSAHYAVGTAGILNIYGLAKAREIPAVKKVTISLPGLARDLQGFRMVQITDIHVSPTIRRPFVEKVVMVVNGLGADMVVLTGDLVDGTVGQLAHDVAPLAKLKSSRGNFFVTGNHEYYSGVLPWVEKLRALGFKVLLNEHHIVKHGRGRLLVAGVTDYRAGNFIPSHRSDPGKAVENALPVDVKILLAHQPKSIHAASQAGFDLQISGHTHGGQFFPWNLFVGLTQPFVAGLHRFKNTQIYVSRGTGYWGPPVRLGAPSEITLIRLAAG